MTCRIGLSNGQRGWVGLSCLANKKTRRILKALFAVLKVLIASLITAFALDTGLAYTASEGEVRTKFRWHSQHFETRKSPVKKDQKSEKLGWFKHHPPEKKDRFICRG